MSSGFTGQHGEYFWYETTDRVSGLQRVSTACPDFILEKYVAISAFDSGHLSLSPGEIQQGWRSVNGIAYSPQVKRDTQIPTDEFDEWYVFLRPTEFSPQQCFVNEWSLSLRDPSHMLESMAPTWDRPAIRSTIERILEVQAEFWSELVRIGPESYASTGNKFIIATRIQGYRDAIVRLVSDPSDLAAQT